MMFYPSFEDVANLSSDSEHSASCAFGLGFLRRLVYLVFCGVSAFGSGASLLEGDFCAPTQQTTILCGNKHPFTLSSAIFHAPSFGSTQKADRIAPFRPIVLIPSGADFRPA
jgi:hypothetical protein